MIAAEVAARGVSYAAALLLLGASLFVVYVPRPALVVTGDAASREWLAVRRFVLRMQVACVVAAIVSGVAWIAVRAAIVSATPLPEAIGGGALGAFVGSTMSGRVLALRLVVALLIGASAAMGSRDAVPSRGFDVVRALLAACFVAALAWTGHAAATAGLDEYLHLAADAVHLVAAGAWLGALPPLALLLARAARARSREPWVARTIVRFSALGVLCVIAILVTGLVNAGFLVDNVPALIGTTYGQLLSLKVALFALMLLLAARNRMRLTPRILAAGNGTTAARASAAAARLARNAWIEAALGVAIALVVGALGVMLPAAHAKIVWPFPFTFDDGWRRAYPTTYQASPLRYTASSIVQGASLYALHCAVCHGAEKLTDQRPGDLYWRVSQGIPGTPMPAFANRLSETRRWQIVNFLEARAEAREASGLTAAIAPWRALPAPDFEFEVDGTQESLSGQRGRPVLLVFYTLPQSQPRLDALARARDDWAQAGVRVLTLPIPGASDPEVIDAYGLFFQAPADHVEFLVDADGYLRTRRLGVEPKRSDDLARLIEDVQRLRKEPRRPPGLGPHGH